MGPCSDGANSPGTSHRDMRRRWHGQATAKGSSVIRPRVSHRLPTAAVSTGGSRPWTTRGKRSSVWPTSYNAHRGNRQPPSTNPPAAATQREFERVMVSARPPRAIGRGDVPTVQRDSEAGMPIHGRLRTRIFGVPARPSPLPRPAQAPFSLPRQDAALARISSMSSVGHTPLS